MTSSLNNQLLAHQISTIKHAAGLGQSVIPYLNEMKAIIRKKVAGFDSEKRTAKRLETMLNTLANTLNKPAGAWLAELEKSLREFAKYETAYQADTIGGWVGVNFTEPTIGQVWAAAQFQPLALSTSPIDFNKMMDDWGVDEVNRLVMGVKSGFVEGLTTRQIIKNVVGDGGLADISLRNAKSVANTAMMHIATNARMAVMEENDDVVIGYEWISTLDGRTSPICQFRDGQVFLFTDKFQPKPPAHFNSCVAGTEITTRRGKVRIEDVKVGDYVLTHTNSFKRVECVMAKHHSGKVYTLKNNLGASVSLTHEHPMITVNGWEMAGNIKPGVKLFNNAHKFIWSKVVSSQSLVEDAVLINAHNIPTSTTDMLIPYSVTSFSAGVSSSIKLNGALTNNKVHNARSYLHLKIKIAVEFAKKVYNQSLVKRWLKLEFLR